MVIAIFGLPDPGSLSGHLTADYGVLCSLHRPLGAHVVSEIALFITAACVLGVAYGLRQSYRQRLRQFEAMYIQRYWKLLDRFSLELLIGSSAGQISTDDEKAIRSYFLLCEDELEMRAKEYIADSTYSTWVEGIFEQLEQPMFKEVLTRLHKEDAFPYEYLNNLLERGKTYDPCGMSWWGRWLRGLAGPDGV